MDSDDEAIRMAVRAAVVELEKRDPLPEAVERGFAFSCGLFWQASHGDDWLAELTAYLNESQEKIKAAAAEIWGRAS